MPCRAMPDAELRTLLAEHLGALRAVPVPLSDALDLPPSASTLPAAPRRRRAALPRDATYALGYLEGAAAALDVTGLELLDSLDLLDDCVAAPAPRGTSPS